MNNINFEDVTTLHKIDEYFKPSNDPLKETYRLLSELKDNPNETYAWRFKYKGKLYANTISGKPSKPLTDKNIILLMQNMVDSMKALVKKDK